METKIMIPDQLLNLLSGDQIAIMKNINYVYPQVPTGMTKFQIENFVLQLGEFPIWYAIYFQCILESFGRFQTILSVLEQQQETKIRNKIKSAKIKAIQNQMADYVDKTNNELDLCRIELLKHEITCSERKIAMTIKELEGKFQELVVFENVRKIAKENMGDVDYGDEKEEALRWYLKFMIQGHPLQRSLFNGDMKKYEPMISEHLLKLDEDVRLLFQQQNANRNLPKR